MSASDRIDLVGVGWPICLLEYQQRIQDVPPGTVIEVRIEDPEMAATIRRLARRQNDRILQERQADRCICLEIRRHGLREAPDDEPPTTGER